MGMNQAQASKATLMKQLLKSATIALGAMIILGTSPAEAAAPPPVPVITSPTMASTHSTGDLVWFSWSTGNTTATHFEFYRLFDPADGSPEVALQSTMTAAEAGCIWTSGPPLPACSLPAVFNSGDVGQHTWWVKAWRPSSTDPSEFESSGWSLVNVFNIQ